MDRGGGGVEQATSAMPPRRNATLASVATVGPVKPTWDFSQSPSSHHPARQPSGPASRNLAGQISRGVSQKGGKTTDLQIPRTEIHSADRAPLPPNPAAHTAEGRRPAPADAPAARKTPPARPRPSPRRPKALRPSRGAAQAQPPPSPAATQACLVATSGSGGEKGEKKWRQRQKP